ncbi:SDR family NAD(P)-dependent oxidoreductase [Conexibacter sp. W3-3-2]|uniref:oxidoreductase n=1 Tax=Conexibacter sp. W3-3-2 TaxID=2675227 RepID=UPI0012BA2FD9|nr:oxidoreductase [Conexibacter sp. W3-3-2]MTD42855.1 SDR family NAD(P)-dependent oxidoreductase [Conexibacter sp. W3-3-2]
MSAWTAADLPRQDGRTVVVTGANSGIGLVTARELARAGARVVLACRSVERGRAAAATMTGDVDVRALDLADLGSVRGFVDALDGPIDVLVNNAGVMALPYRLTADGFEMQLGTNHLGHFALTGLLLGRITDRVVTVSSGFHRLGTMDFDDLMWERGYHRWKAYARSKLANLLFTLELQRRLAAADAPVRAVAAHPGYAATGLQAHTETVQDRVMGLLNRVVAQSPERGALPTLYAATQDLPGAAYVGPDGPGEMRGAPQLVGMSGAAQDPAAARRLWDASEALTGVTFEFAGSGVAASA